MPDITPRDSVAKMTADQVCREYERYLRSNVGRYTVRNMGGGWANVRRYMSPGNGASERITRIRERLAEIRHGADGKPA